MEIRFCEHCIHRNDCIGKELYKEELREGTVECLDYQDEQVFLHINFRRMVTFIPMKIFLMNIRRARKDM